MLFRSASAHVLAAFDGTDFTSPLPQIPEVIRLINQRMEGELELVHSTPAAYFEAVKADIDPSTLVQLSLIHICTCPWSKAPACC